MGNWTRRNFLSAVGFASAAEIGRQYFGDVSHHEVFAKPMAPSRRASADLTELVGDIHAKHKTPGLIGAIVDTEGLLAIGAAGIRKVGASEPMTIDDKIHLGSCTKAMTATLIGQLVEKKRLRLDTKMREAFPKLARTMNEKMAGVTVAQLLDHTAGLSANVDWWEFDRSGKSISEQRLNIAKQVLSAAPEQDPGSKHLYSNVGYMLLGTIVEVKTSKPWEDVIKARLFRPLEMQSAGFGSPGTAKLVDQPWGHVHKGDALQPIQHDNAPVLGPAGRVHCSMADWAKYVSCCLRMENEDSKILSAATQRKIVTPLPDSSYAGGWVITQRPWAGGRTLMHNGSNNMWYCVAWLAPLKGFAVLSATNVAGDDANKACDDLAAAQIKEFGSLKPR